MKIESVRIRVFDFAREMFDAFMEEMTIASIKHRKNPLTEVELAGYFLSNFIHKVTKESEEVVYCPADQEAIPFNWPIFSEGTTVNEIPYSRDIDIPKVLYDTCVQDIIPEINLEVTAKRLPGVEPVTIESLVSWAIKLMVNYSYNNEQMPLSSKELPIEKNEYEKIHTLTKSANA